MHLLGGVAIANFFHVCVVYLDRLGLMRVGSGRAAVVMVLGLVSIATITWESAEFLADFFFQAGAQRGLADTMKDQIMGLIGGVVYVAFFRKVRAPGYPRG